MVATTMDPNSQRNVATGGRIIAGFMGIVFGGIGVSVLGFLWLSPWNQFDSPPLFFRIFGTFIALPFVGFGVMMIVGGLAGGKITNTFSANLGTAQAQPNPTASIAGNYVCPNCGATLTRADVSPMGDVKCEFCGTWFNIHRSAGKMPG